MIALKIVWKNLRCHQGRSLVLGCILFFGAFLISVGNGVISGMERGLATNISQLFTGDIVVIAKEQKKKDDIFFGISSKPLKVISNFDTVKKTLGHDSCIDKFLPATAGMVLALSSNSEIGRLLALGVDIQQYRRMFPDSFTVTEGRMLAPGQRGILVSQASRKYFYDFMNFWLLPEKVKPNKMKLPFNRTPGRNSPDIRSDLILMGVNTANSMVDIRAPVRGIIRYKALNKIWGYYSIMDLESFREAYDYTTNTDSQARLSVEERQLLASDSLDGYFVADNMVDRSQVGHGIFTKNAIKTRTKKETPQISDLDSGAYNLIFVKLRPGISQPEAIDRLNHQFIKNRLNLRAIGWKSAVGIIGSLGELYKGFLHIFVNFLFFVAGIVIMNTLIMNAMERVSEFAMMRAVGARRCFLQKMFVLETGTLFLCFGGLGIVTGMMVIYLLNGANLTTTNEILQLVYGGDKLSPVITTKDVLLEVVELGGMACFSALYPLRVVGKIKPLDAIKRD